MCTAARHKWAQALAECSNWQTACMIAQQSKCESRCHGQVTELQARFQRQQRPLVRRRRKAQGSLRPQLRQHLLPLVPLLRLLQRPSWLT